MQKNIKIIIRIVLTVNLFFCCFFTKAQTSDSVRIAINNILAPLNKTLIPTGILAENTYPLLNLATYNGILTAENNMSFSQWRILYEQTLSGAYVAPVGLPNITQLNTDYDAATINSTSNVVSLALINYASINPNAINLGLMSVVNGQLYDGIAAKAGSSIVRPKNTYFVNKLFLAAAANTTAKNGVLQLIFKPSLFYTNSGLSVSNIEVDFDNGNGFVTASFNTVLSGTYSSIGNKQLNYKVTFSDGSILQCYNTVYVPFIPTPSNAARYSDAAVNSITGADIPDVVINSATNAHAGVDLFIRRSTSNNGSNTNPSFRKPLIIVEGLDLSSGTTLLGNGYNYNQFRDEMRDAKTRFISGSNPLQPFDQYLDDEAGYDLIFVNWRNGVDDILRNAQALRDVINYVNSRKLAGAEQNVIMGISMGGLVSRYCLAQMVKAGGTGNNDPQTRLLITHDSPHRGANVPLAMQHFIQGLRKQRIKAFLGIFNFRLDEIIPKFKDVNTIINSPAATQQLLVRVVDENGTVATNTFLDGAYRTMVNFENTGFTAPYRFVATSNGSQCGIANAAPYSSLANFDADGIANIFGLTLWTEGRTYMDMRRLPNIGQSARILDFTLKLKIKILVFNLLKISMEIQQNSTGNLPALDGFAGGTRGLGKALSNSISNIDPASGTSNWLIFGYTYNYSTPYIAPTFTFINTASALDAQNVNAVNIPYSVPVTGINGSRAANYIAQEKITLPAPDGVTDNVNHTDFYARTCRWLYNEMQNITQPIDCSDYCEGPTTSATIIGPRIVCNSAIYNITNIPAGYTVTWSLPVGSGSTLQLSPNSTGSQCTVTNLHYYQLNVNLIVTFSKPGCTAVSTISKFISNDNDYQISSTSGYGYTQVACMAYNVNHPAETGVVNNNGIVFIHAGCMVTVNLGDLGIQGKQLTFEGSGAPPLYWNYDGNYLRFAMPASAGGVPASFKISGQGACFDRNLLFYVISNNGKATFAAVPNPVNDVLTIKVQEDKIAQANNTNTAKEYIINITEFNTSLPIKQFRINKTGVDFQINLVGLKTGYYAIEINDGSDKQVLKVYKL